MSHRNQLFVLLVPLLFVAATIAAEADERPNILFAFADDWGWPHAGAYGDPVVKTPAFDRLAREGGLFNHAYISSPSCTPSRGAVLTGQHFWRLEGAGNLWSVFPDKFDTYPELLSKLGYFASTRSKAWGPGRTETEGRKLTGTARGVDPLRNLLKNRPKGKPFCHWLGTLDPHRGYKKDSGAASGMDLSKIKLFPHFPDSPEVRGDVADYYFEVQRFDKLVADSIAALEEAGELDNTIIVMSGDHGMPFPGCKSNNYDSGARVPLVIRWPKKIKAGTVIDDFVSLVDIAPTFYDAAGLTIPDDVAAAACWRCSPGATRAIAATCCMAKNVTSPLRRLPTWAAIRRAPYVLTIFSISITSAQIAGPPVRPTTNRLRSPEHGWRTVTTGRPRRTWWRIATRTTSIASSTIYPLPNVPPTNSTI